MTLCCLACRCVMSQCVALALSMFLPWKCECTRFMPSEDVWGLEMICGTASRT